MRQYIVSIHAPVKEATDNPIPASGIGAVSIHAPVKEAPYYYSGTF